MRQISARFIACIFWDGDRGPYLNLAAFLGNQQFTASKIKELYLHDGADLMGIDGVLMR